MIINPCSVSDCNKITDGIVLETLRNNKEISFCSKHSFMYHYSKYLYSKNDKELIKFNYYLCKPIFLLHKINSLLNITINFDRKFLTLIYFYDELLNELDIEVMIKFIKFRRKKDEEHYNNIKCLSSY